MTMDRTLKIHGGLVGKRSVLSRAERIALLTEQEKFDPEKDSALGLPKVRIKTSKAGTKTKKAAEEPKPAEGAEGAAPVAAAGEAVRVAPVAAAPVKKAAADRKHSSDKRGQGVRK